MRFRMPEISVLLPIYNAGPFLRPAIESILGQRSRDFELVLIDDGSTDGSADVAAACRDDRIRVVRHETNRGLAATLNEGLQLARGPLVARQDQDDLSHLDRLARQAEVFGREPSLALLGTRGHVIDEQDRHVGDVDRPLEPASVRWYSIVDNPFIHTSVMFRRDVVRDLGGYCERYAHSEDFELWSRVVRLHGAWNLPDRLISYRLRKESMTDRIDRPSDGGRRRAEFHRIIKEVVAENVRALRTSDLDPADAELLACYILGIDRRALDPFLDVFMRLLASYEMQDPAGTRTADFRWTLARQIDAIAYRVQPPSRMAAVRIFGRMLARRPRLITSLATARSLALVTVGHAARRRAGGLKAARSTVR